MEAIKLGIERDVDKSSKGLVTSEGVDEFFLSKKLNIGQNLTCAINVGLRHAD